MYKNLSKYLLISASLIINRVSAASNADDFFAKATENPDISVLAPIFNNLPQQEQQEISLKVKTRSAKDLGISANLFFVLKDYLQNGTFVKSATPSVRAILHKEQEKASASKQTAQNQETDAQKLHKEFEAQRKQREAAEEQRKNDEQKQRISQEHFAVLKAKETQQNAAIANSEASERENLQKAFTQSSEETKRNATVHEEETARSNIDSEYAQSLAAAQAATNQQQLTALQGSETETRNKDLIDAEDAEIIQLQGSFDVELAAAKTTEAQRKQREAAEEQRKQSEFNAKLTALQNAESTDRADIANNALIKNSERNELSRRFQTEKSRLEEEQRKKASEAIAAALAEAKLSMETQLEDYLLELNRIREDLLKKLQAEQSEALKAELQKKEQELTELTKQVNEIQQETLIAHDTAKVFGNYVADTIIETFARSTSQSTEAQQFKSIIDTQNFEQIISKIKEFIQKGTIQNDQTINQTLERALTIHGARLNRIDNIKIKIANLTK